MNAQVIDTDVLIVGAGVAGAAAASVLAERHSVTLIDQNPSPQGCRGEILPGVARLLLQRLDLLREFEADRHQPSLGAASIWGSRQMTRRDCFADPYGPGWHLDRPRFDAMCRKRAADRGANLIAPVRTLSLSREPARSRRWSARFRASGVEQTFRFRFLIDATGRRTLLSGRLPATPIAVEDRLVVRLAHAQKCPGPTSVDHFTLVEAVSEGWWYLTSLPDGNRVLGFFTDSDLPAARITRDRVGFANQLTKSQQIAQFVTPEDLIGPIVCAPARSQRSPKPCGDDWCATGDAAMAFDPLSSQGISNALYTGILAAEAAAARLAGAAAASERYIARLDAMWNRYRNYLASCYRMERRFSREAFWQRRS
jgi:flavin-dependent dehydrogenase